MSEINRHYASFGGALQAPAPIDPRMTSETIADRDAIPERVRFEGLVTRVNADNEYYELRGGVTNDCWYKLSDRFAAGGSTVKLTDEITEDMDAQRGTAASPKAVWDYFGDSIATDEEVVEMLDKYFPEN